MKFASFSFVMLGLGFAAGWVAKPSSLHPPSDSTSRSGGSAPAGHSGMKGIHEGSLASNRSDGAQRRQSLRDQEEQRVRLRQMQEESVRQLSTQLRGKIQKQIERLSTRLKLRPEQVNSLIAWMDRKLETFEHADWEAPDYASDLDALMKQLGNKAMEDHLASSLTGEQTLAMADFKERELLANADVSALQGLSKLQGLIDFEQGQRDQVYRLLAKSLLNNGAADI